MNKYELLFIFDPDVDEEARASFIERIKGIIQEAGEVEAVDEWGTRKLAYEIKKKNEGYYVRVNFKAGPEVPKLLAVSFSVTTVSILDESPTCRLNSIKSPPCFSKAPCSMIPFPAYCRRLHIISNNPPKFYTAQPLRMNFNKRPGCDIKKAPRGPFSL
jgi:small subunit ribosomal protein S6